MLFEELGKLKRSSIMTSIVLMALGVLMVICPEAYIGSMVSIMGYALIIVAVVTVLEFISSRKALMNHVYLVGALILALLGLSVLIFPDNMIRIVGWLFGAGLVISGVANIINAVTYARRSQRQAWWVLIVLSVLQILCGLIIFINPWWNSPRTLFQVIGVILLFSSVVGIVRLIFIWPIKSE